MFNTKVVSVVWQVWCQKHARAEMGKDLRNLNNIGKVYNSVPRPVNKLTAMQMREHTRSVNLADSIAH